MALSDSKSKTFGESNPGPHRYFERTWVRNGDSYQLQVERILPSAYNTLVEFVYRLSTGDEAAAMDLINDPSLVDAAKRLGLVQDPPGQHWVGDCQHGQNFHDEIPPCTVKTPSGLGLTISMIPNGDDWLISAIDPCTPSYDDRGAHCN